MGQGFFPRLPSGSGSMTFEGGAVGVPFIGIMLHDDVKCVGHGIIAPRSFAVEKFTLIVSSNRLCASIAVLNFKSKERRCAEPM